MEIYTITLNIFDMDTYGNIYNYIEYIWKYMEIIWTCMGIYIYNWNLPCGFLNIATEAIAHVVRGFILPIQNGDCNHYTSNYLKATRKYTHGKMMEYINIREKKTLDNLRWDLNAILIYWDVQPII
jgi:hypothetical protein